MTTPSNPEPSWLIKLKEDALDGDPGEAGEPPYVDGRYVWPDHDYCDADCPRHHPEPCDCDVRALTERLDSPDLPAPDAARLRARLDRLHKEQPRMSGTLTVTLHLTYGQLAALHRFLETHPDPDATRALYDQIAELLKRETSLVLQTTDLPHMPPWAIALVPDDAS